MSKHGLVLSSDGSKSFFEIGEWKALNEINVNISMVGGAYIGALNAALIAQGDFNKAVGFWNSVVKKQILDVNKYVAYQYTENWSTQDTKYFKRSFNRFVQGKTEELRPLRETLDMFIDENAVRDSEIKLALTTIDLNSLGNKHLTIDDIPKGKLHMYLIAGSCFPQISRLSQTVNFNEIGNEAVIKLLVENGCKRIISSDNSEVQTIRKYKGKDILIKSGEFAGMSDEYTASSLKKNLSLGYLDTLKTFGEVEGKLYYLSTQEQSFEYQRFIDKIGVLMPGTTGELIEKLLGTRDVSKEEFENRARNMLSKSNLKNGPIQLAILENLAKILEVERNEKYSCDRLISIILATVEETLKEASKKIKDVSYLSSLVNNPPSYTDLNKEDFIAYFLIMISAKPEAYKNLKTLFDSFPDQGKLGVLTLLYLAY